MLILQNRNGIHPISVAPCWPQSDPVPRKCLWKRWKQRSRSGTGRACSYTCFRVFSSPRNGYFFGGGKSFCRFKKMDGIKKSWDWSRLIHQGVKPFRVGIVTESESESSSIFGCTLPRGSRSWEGVMPPDDLGTMTRNCDWKYASLRVWMSKDQPNPCIFSAPWPRSLRFSRPNVSSTLPSVWVPRPVEHQRAFVRDGHAAVPVLWINLSWAERLIF